MTGGKYDPMGPVFISYRQKDGSRRARMIATFLQACGIPVWLDSNDLPPGETEHRVNDAFREGISAAILLVTDDIGNSEFVPKVELPALLDLDKPSSATAADHSAVDEDDTGFRLFIANAVAHDNGGFDLNAPDKKLKTACLKDYKQYGLTEQRNDLPEILRDLLRLRLNNWAKEGGEELRVYVQSRPKVDAGSATNYNAHLAIRLASARQSDLPTDESYLSLVEGLPIFADAVHRCRRIMFQGGGHASLLWTLGVALPNTRHNSGEIVFKDHDAKCWEEAERVGENAPGDPQTRRVESFLLRDGQAQEVPFDEVLQDQPKRLVVFLSTTNPEHHVPLQQLQGRLAAAEVVLLKISGSGHFPPSEGYRLATRLACWLRRLGSRGVELHVASSLPAGMNLMIARQTNTIVVTCYELDKSAKPTSYRAMGTLQPNRPVQGALPDADLAEELAPVTELINYTPHDVNLYDGDTLVRSWLRVEPWVRRAEACDEEQPLQVGDVAVPLHQITEGNLTSNPPARPGVGYIVPRISAQVAQRPDFYFPYREVRDDKGQIIGCLGLARFSPPDTPGNFLKLLLLTAMEGDQRNV